jgi:hypothetical protein
MAYLKPVFQVLRGIVSFPVSLVFSGLEYEKMKLTYFSKRDTDRIRVGHDDSGGQKWNNRWFVRTRDRNALNPD